MSEYTKKRARTDFGEIEYVTEQCVECTNEYVLDELTLGYVSHDVDQEATISESSDQLVPICLGCAEEVYGMDDSLLSQPELFEFIRAEPDYKLKLEPTVDSQEEEVITEHGTVTVTVDQCDHCGTPVTVDDLCAVHFFVAIVDEVLQTTAPLNCPECRELYLSAPHVASGRTVQERQIAERKEREERVRELKSDSEESVLVSDDTKTVVGWALIGMLLMMIFTAIGFPSFGTLLLIISVATGTISIFIDPESEDQ